MNVIEAYILRRTVAIFAASLAWVLLIVWTTQVLNRLDLVTSSGQTAATFFFVALLALPPVIPIIMPFAVGIGVAQTLATMNADSELVVISAAGSPKTTVIRPILIVAVVASLLAFFINNIVEPYSRQTMRQTIADSNANLITTVLQEGAFQKVGDGLFVQVSERLPGGQLGGIFVADSRDDAMRLLYYARRGASLEREGGSILVMRDGQVHRQAANGDVSVIRFESYAIDLSEFTSGGGEPTLYPKDRGFFYLVNPDPDDPFYKSNPQAFRSELHQRMTEWLYPIVFALIGIAVAGDARSFREARLHPMVTTIAIGLLVRWAGFIAANEAEKMPAFSALLYVVPIGMMLISAWFIATSRVMELPTSWTEKLLARIRRNNEILRGFWQRLVGRVRPDGGRA
ncbi:LPS export ABC transporter permease LptF [Nitratireductor basaltis]|uniref:Permease YjgP/YjgQ n=1 Tax=Nitratireductor basaltis TaxID=472175 RepID=A0A084UC46_9HYPH|nr:LPS export ABC transporter permease LptF [Nitratireductor basaltis]KFB10532.1 Permease YjgP/YjgQ [Nitratireductor basaltis]